MTEAEWIPVTMETPLPELPCLLCTDYEEVYLGFTAFDFYDLENVKYWFPMPKFPFTVQGFSSDEAMIKVLNMKEKI